MAGGGGGDRGKRRRGLCGPWNSWALPLLAPFREPFGHFGRPKVAQPASSSSSGQPASSNLGRAPGWMQVWGLIQPASSNLGRAPGWTQVWGLIQPASSNLGRAPGLIKHEANSLHAITRDANLSREGKTAGFCYEANSLHANTCYYTRRKAEDFWLKF